MRQASPSDCNAASQAKAQKGRWHGHLVSYQLGSVASGGNAGGGFFAAGMPAGLASGGNAGGGFFAAGLPAGIGIARAIGKVQPIKALRTDSLVPILSNCNLTIGSNRSRAPVLPEKVPETADAVEPVLPEVVNGSADDAAPPVLLPEVEPDAGGACAGTKGTTGYPAS